MAQIRRQEPGHYAFYKMSARGLAEQLAGWQKWLVRHLRRISFAPVGANNAEQKADFGDLMAHPRHRPTTSSRSPIQISRVERELLWARDAAGMRVPDYVARAFREAVELARAPRAR